MGTHVIIARLVLIVHFLHFKWKMKWILEEETIKMQNVERKWLKRRNILVLRVYINTYEPFCYIKGRRYDDDDIRSVPEGWQKMRGKLGWLLRPYWVAPSTLKEVQLPSIAWRGRRILSSARIWSQERDTTAECPTSGVSSASSSLSIFSLHFSCGSFARWYVVTRSYNHSRHLNA